MENNFNNNNNKDNSNNCDINNQINDNVGGMTNQTVDFSQIGDNSNDGEKKAKKKNRYLIKLKKRAVLKVAAVVLGAVVVGNAVGFGVGYFYPTVKEYAESLSNKDGDTTLLSDSSENNSENSDNPISNVSKSVVSITTISEDEQQQNLFGQSNQSGDSSDTQYNGSGIIFYQTAKKVYIATNYHVISGASSVHVGFDDDKYVTAKLVGKHQLADLAVISVDKEALKKVGIESVKVAYFGDSDTLSVGDDVIAVGNAFGDGNTATHGIVSVVQKDIPITNTDKLSVIQTDAAINEGNDGGALINKNGEVIGINTAKYSYYTVEGVGYSISSNVAKSVIEEIMNKKSSPYLGVSVKSITEEAASSNNLPQTGVIVEKVVKGGAADLAGIKESDIITGFNDTPIFTPTQLTEAVRQANVGDKVEIKVIRNGIKQVVCEAVLMENNGDSF